MSDSSSGIISQPVSFNVGTGVPKNASPGSINLDQNSGAVYVASASESAESGVVLIQVTDPTKLSKDGTAVKAEYAENANAATNALSATNADAANRLVTPVKINGTEFDGTENITTNQWGKSRYITIGNKMLSVDGSADETWTLNQIGASEGWSIKKYGEEMIQSSGWYRIGEISGTNASTGAEIGSLFGASGIFIVSARRGQSSSYAVFAASAPSSSDEPQVVINQLHFSAGVTHKEPSPSKEVNLLSETGEDSEDKNYLDKARIVYLPKFEELSGEEGRYRVIAYVDIYVYGDKTYPTSVNCMYVGNSWSMRNLDTVQEDSFTGYKIKEITFRVGGAESVVMTGPTADAPGLSGSVPAPQRGDGSKFLRGDGTWADVDVDGKISDMTGASQNAAGSSGLVPAPAAGKQNTFLRGDGTWAAPPKPADSTLRWSKF